MAGNVAALEEEKRPYSSSGASHLHQALAPNAPQTISPARLSGALLAIGACAVAQWYIRAHIGWSYANTALVGGSVVAALLLGRPTPYLPGEDLTALPIRGVQKWLWCAIAAAGVGTVAWATQALANNWARAFDRSAPLVFLGWLICTVALARLHRRQTPGSELAVTKWETAAVLAIVAVGFFLRFYRYTYFPPPYGVAAVEEPQEGLMAYLVTYGGGRVWEFFGDRWLPAPFFKLFGVSLTTLRIPFTLVSGITVLALYFLLRQLVARPAALLCTALFAVCHWHLMYARIAHAVFPTTLVVVIVLALCAWVHRRGGLAAYPWIGFLSGYTLYAYAGYRGTTLFVSLFLALSFLIHVFRWRHAAEGEVRLAARTIVRTQAVGLALFAVALVLTAMPLVSLLRQNPTYYFEAANRSLVDREYYTDDTRAWIAQRTKRLEATALIFNHRGDDSATFNLPGEPQLDPIAGTLFVLGLAYTVIWGRYRFQGFFALMFIVLLVLGTTFVHNLDVRRLQQNIPLLYVLIAFVIDRLWQATAPRFGRAGHTALAVVAIAVAALSLKVNYDIYFNRWITNHNLRLVFQNYYTVAIRYMDTLPKGSDVLFVSDALNFFSENDLNWLRGDRIRGKATTDLMPLFSGDAGAWEGRDLRVVIQEPYDRHELAALLRQRFPAATCEPVEYADAPSNLWMTACHVPPNGPVREFTGGVHTRYFRDHEGVPSIEREQPAISYGLMSPGCTVHAADRSCRIEWEGTLTAPSAGKYEFAAEVRNGVVQMTIDGQPTKGVRELSAGPHAIQMEARLPQGELNGVRLRWRPPGTQTFELVPFASFDGPAAQ